MYGNYRQLSLKHEQLAFSRQTPEKCVIVAVNAADKPARFRLAIPAGYGSRLIDLLNPEETFQIIDGHATIDPVWPCWARITVVR
jgi:hypothetical protein